MTSLRMEASDFKAKKEHQTEMARRIAAFFITCGVDLEDALSTRGDARTRICRRLVRLIERERLRGMRRHWSYDLNRHIALKQVLQELEGKSKTALRQAAPARRNRKRLEN